MARRIRVNGTLYEAVATEGPVDDWRYKELDYDNRGWYTSYDEDPEGEELYLEFFEYGISSRSRQVSFIVDCTDEGDEVGITSSVKVGFMKGGRVVRTFDLVEVERDLGLKMNPKRLIPTFSAWYDEYLTGDQKEDAKFLRSDQRSKEARKELRLALRRAR